MDELELAKQEQEARDRKKMYAQIGGGIADAFTGGQSFGDVFLGRQGQRTSAFDKVTNVFDSAKSPMDKYKQNVALSEDAEKRKIAKESKDPNSDYSKKKMEMYSKMVPSMADKMAGMSAEQLDAAFPTLSQTANRLLDQDFQKQQDKTKYQQQLNLAKFNQDAETNRELAKANAKAGGTGQGLEVPGVGQALTKTDATDLKNAKISKDKFDRQMKELIDLREKYGTESWNKEAIARGEQLSKDLLLTYKNLAKLGVLSKSDEAIINEIIPTNPLGAEGIDLPLVGNIGGRGIGDAFNFITGQDPKLTKLKGFQSDLNEDYANTVATRTRGGEQLANQMRERFRKTPEQEGGGIDLLPEAHASGGGFDGALKNAASMGPQDLEALRWAKNNKGNPKAAQILMRLNSKLGAK